MNCISCRESFHKINGTNDCFDKSLLDKGFYLKDDKFYPCDDNCLTCSGGKNGKSNNCLSCDNINNGLYLIEDQKICEHSDISGYYLDILDNGNKVLRKCYKSCKNVMELMRKIVIIIIALNVLIIIISYLMVLIDIIVMIEKK